MIAGLGNPVVELYELVLRNPSLFGRLVHIANLWNPETSRYDRNLPDRFRGPEVDKALARWHQTFFLEWLAHSLVEKEKDAALYWKSNGGNGKTLREVGEAAIPPLVREEERKFFLQDLGFIQAML